MKKYVLLLAVVGAFLFPACNEQDIEPFGERHEVYFLKYFMDERAPGTAKADSTDVTFFFAKPTDDYVMAEVIVVLAGRPIAEDLHFGLKVVDEMTTANPDEYTLEDEYTFHARPLPENAERIQDTIQIRMNKSRRLDDLKDGVRLVLEIVPTGEVHVGQFERSRAVIHLTKDAVRPLWWTREVEAYLLGSYSSLKYKTFLENVPGAYELDGAMIENHPDQALKLVRAFKAWLAENPVYDTDNYEWMSVNV
ncbi:DUF4843 domain-containing protein [uncultured Butyricimonas sp.]|uniref:DUF4843 domain-containing protein n=1 Tax=uncultured Butyricimonas sp. TaxID=1268785 RepID=UPI0026DCBBF9|nr:DUF4843 domain-containing protein [uncultured Butyricimonas sp.]